MNLQQYKTFANCMSDSLFPRLIVYSLKYRPVHFRQHFHKIWNSNLMSPFCDTSYSFFLTFIGRTTVGWLSFFTFGGMGWVFGSVSMTLQTTFTFQTNIHFKWQHVFLYLPMPRRAFFLIFYILPCICLQALWYPISPDYSQIAIKFHDQTL